MVYGSRNRVGPTSNLVRLMLNSRPLYPPKAEIVHALLLNGGVGNWISHLSEKSEVGAAGAGVAVGAGAGGIVLTNQNGAVLILSGRQAGLIVAADLNGLVISVR